MRANVGCSWLGLIVIGGHFVLEIIEAELFCPMNDRRTTVKGIEQIVNMPLIQFP